MVSFEEKLIRASIRSSGGPNGNSSTSLQGDEVDPVSEVVCQGASDASGVVSMSIPSPVEHEPLNRNDASLFLDSTRAWYLPP